MKQNVFGPHYSHSLLLKQTKERAVIQKLKWKESSDNMKLWLGNSFSFSFHSILIFFPQCPNVFKGALFGKKESGNLDLFDMDPSPLNNNNINNNNVNNDNNNNLIIIIIISFY